MSGLENRPLTVTQFAAVVGVCERTARGMIARGEVTPARVGRLVRIPRSEVERVVSARR
jgi:excisionase family DNA binding protein